MFSDTRSKPPSCAPEERAYIVGYGGDSLNVSDAVKATICALAATGYSRDRCENAAGQLLINDGDRAFLATPVPDSDGDGIPDSQDQCPQSVISPTVVLGACDSGVPNVLAANGCTIVDNINKCASGSGNTGSIASCSAVYVSSLVPEYLSGREMGQIQSCVHALP
jgi:hypothetical protein